MGKESKIFRSKLELRVTSFHTRVHVSVCVGRTCKDVILTTVTGHSESLSDVGTTTNPEKGHLTSWLGKSFFQSNFGSLGPGPRPPRITRVQPTLMGDGRVGLTNIEHRETKRGKTIERTWFRSVLWTPTGVHINRFLQGFWSTSRRLHSSYKRTTTSTSTVQEKVTLFVVRNRNT